MITQGTENDKLGRVARHAHSRTGLKSCSIPFNVNTSKLACLLPVGSQCSQHIAVKSETRFRFLQAAALAYANWQ
jgi:hypothetical protein